MAGRVAAPRTGPWELHPLRNDSCATSHATACSSFMQLIDARARLTHRVQVALEDANLKPPSSSRPS
jgi:hypothetical protein